MGIVSANQINEGYIIKQDRGDMYFYVHDIEKGIEVNGQEYVKNFIVFPILSEEHAISGSQTVPLLKDQITDAQGSLQIFDQDVVVISDRALRKIEVNPDHYFANYAGKVKPEIQMEIERTFDDMGGGSYRLSGLDDDARYRYSRLDYTNITAPIHESVVLDGDEKIKPREPKKKRAKAKTLLNNPDIYLEDAVKLGFIDEETYKILTQNQDEGELFSLGGALALAQKVDKGPLLSFINGETFDNAFPEGKIPFEQENKIYNHPAVKSFADISISDALDKGILRNEFTVEVLSSQGVNDDFDVDDEDTYDERLILNLDEAITLVAVDPEYLGQYDRPNKPHLQLTKKQQSDVISDVKNAFNVLSKGQLLNDLSHKIISGQREFMQQSQKLLQSGSAFMIHDPAVEVENKLVGAVEKQKAKILAGRPPKLDL